MMPYIVILGVNSRVSPLHPVQIYQQNTSCSYAIIIIGEAPEWNVSEIPTGTPCYTTSIIWGINSAHVG
jgi:hypothetical protein